MFERVVIKLSGEALAVKGQKDEPLGRFDDEVIGGIAKQIAQVLKDTQVSLVVGGGNFWRGKKAKPEIDRTKSDQIGMLGTVMNAIYLTQEFLKYDIASVVMTPFPVGNFTIPYDRDLALDYMARKIVVIHAGGLGHPFFSTDTITALRAAELSADCVLYAKSVDGVYDKDPKTFPEARKYKTISYEKIIQDNLEAADIAAMNISREAETTSLVFDLRLADSIVKACANNEETYAIGTKISLNIKEEYYV